MLDNILYDDNYGQIVDITVSNSGQASNILYKDLKGFTQNIEQIHSGEAENLLFPKTTMQLIGPPPVELGFGYSG